MRAMLPETVPPLVDAEEATRLQCLRTLHILDTPPDPVLDALTRALAAQLGCPISLVSLVDEQRQWFKSNQGLGVDQTPREWAFCAHAIGQPGLLEVPDATADRRFEDNPLVVGEPHIRFYAGQPLIVHGQAIGALCVIDRKPRRLSARERQLLAELALVAQTCIARGAAQQRLALTEIRVGDMLRAASDFTWEADADMRLVWLSDGVEAVLGQSPQQLIGRPLWNPLVLDAMGKPLPGRPTLHDCLGRNDLPTRLLVELPVRHRTDATASATASATRSDQPLPLLISAVAVHGADWEALGWRGTAKDMTGLLEGARRANELELRLTKITTQLPGVIFILERKVDGWMTMPYASQGLQRVFDRTPEAAASGLPPPFCNVAAAEREALVDAMLASAERGEDWVYGCVVKRPSQPDRWAAGRATPRTLDDGTQVWYGYAADSTDRRNAAAAMAEAQRRLQQAIDAGRLGVLSFDLEAQTVELDTAARQIHGNPVANAAEKTSAMPLTDWMAGIALADHAAVSRALAPARRQSRPSRPSRVSYRRAQPDDHTTIGLQVEVSADGRQLIGLCRDITEQVRAEAALRDQLRLEAARQEQTDFLSRVSHELRTPLNAVLGFVELMRNDTKHPVAEQHREWLQHVMNAGLHLTTQINDLLDLTRIESGHHPIHPEPLRAEAMLLSCHAMLEPIALQNRSMLSVRASDPAIQVQADRRALGQVLFIVVGNAIKFNRRGGVVASSISSRDGHAVITVSDDGPGIAPERRSRLFQPFERLGRAPGTPEGSGLGLAISRRLVEAMQGRISASFPPDGGTCITIELPLAKGPVDGIGGGAGVRAGTATAASAASPGGKAGAPRGVEQRAPRQAICLDHSPDQGRRLQAQFGTHAGWRLTLVDDADALHAALAASPFELVLIDLNPGLQDRQQAAAAMSRDTHAARSLELVRALRADPALRDLHCVAFSARGAAEQVAEAMEAGFDDFWHASMDIGELHWRLDSLPRQPSPGSPP